MTRLVLIVSGVLMAFPALAGQSNRPDLVDGPRSQAIALVNTAEQDSAKRASFYAELSLKIENATVHWPVAEERITTNATIA